MLLEPLLLPHISVNSTLYFTPAAKNHVDAFFPSVKDLKPNKRDAISLKSN